MQVKTIVFPNRIQVLRKDQKLGLRELAEAAGISISYLSMIERGLREPALDTQEALARELGQNSAKDLQIRPDTETELHLWRTLMDQIRPNGISAAVFGRKLKVYRQQRGVSVRALCEQEEAKLADLQPWFVRELELGSRLPQEEDLKALAIAFNLSGPEELGEKLEEALEQEARQIAAAKLRSEAKAANAGKLVFQAGNVILDSNDSRGLTDTQRDPPPLNWSTLKYVLRLTGGPKCPRSVTSRKRSSPSCVRSM